MRPKPGFMAAGAVMILAAAVAAARADNLMAWVQPRLGSDDKTYQERLIAKAAFTEVLANRAETLGMKAPLNLAPYAPIYPDGMIVYETENPSSDSGGTVQYAAAASLRATLDFYEDAAALQHMPFAVTPDGPDSVIFKAGSGPRRVQARLNRQFENGTQVDLAYN